MPPRAQHQKIFALVIMRLQLRVFLLRAPHVFLVVIAANRQRWYCNGVEMALNAARRPDRVVRRVIEKELPRGQHLAAGFLNVLLKAATLEKIVVSIHWLAVFVFA